MLIAITYRSKPSGGRREGFRLGSCPMRSKGGGVNGLRPRSWQTAWGYFELEGAPSREEFALRKSLLDFDLAGISATCDRRGETSAATVQGFRGALESGPSEDGTDVSSKPGIGQHLFT